MLKSLKRDLAKTFFLYKNKPEKWESEFSLEGLFLDLVVKDGYKLKGLMVETGDGEIYIKLSKELRYRFNWNLAKGSLIKVSGTKKVNTKTGAVKFKAERIMGIASQGIGLGLSELGLSKVELAPVEFLQAASVVYQPPQSTKMNSPKMNSPKMNSQKTNSQKTKPVTILMCQKSDCMKRGGKSVCAALQAEINKQNLDGQVVVKATGCMKNCKKGVNLVMPDKTRHSCVRSQDVPRLIATIQNDILK